jgi:hypothetical protein
MVSLAIPMVADNAKLRCIDYNPMQRIWSPLEKPTAYEPLGGQELQYGNNNVDTTMSDTSSFTASLMSDDDDDQVDMVGVEEPRPEFRRGTVSHPSHVQPV